MRMKFKAYYILIFNFFLVLSIHAEGPLATTSAQDSSAPEEQIEATWIAIQRAIENQDSTNVNQHFAELIKLRDQIGLDSMEKYSLALIEQAQRYQSHSDKDWSILLAKRAKELSPKVPLINIRVWQLGIERGVTPLFNSLALALQHPLSLVFILKSLVYPALLALLFATYLSFVILFGCRIRTILRSVARYVPHSMRGILTPFIVFVTLVLPCAIGPLWCLFLWSLLIYLLLPNSRWLGFISGSVIVLFATLIPPRENVEIWYNSSDIQNMLRVLSADYSESSELILEELLKGRNSDAVVHYALGQYLRRSGQLDRAKSQFEIAASLLGNQPWTNAQIGLIAYLKEDLQTAETYFKKAEELGLTSANFYFDFSKVKLLNFDTEGSRNYYTLALNSAPKLVEELKEREETVGDKYLAEINLPPLKVVSSALMPVQDVPLSLNAKLNSLMYATTPFRMTLLGAALIVGFFTIGINNKRIRFHAYYNKFTTPGLVTVIFKLIPGGSYVIAGRVVTGFLILLCFIILSLPMLGWPKEASTVGGILLSIWQYYSYLLLVSLVACAFVGRNLREEQ